jgi:hypothetical protein
MSKLQVLDSKLPNRTAVASYRTPENCHNANVRAATTTFLSCDLV